MSDRQSSPDEAAPIAGRPPELSAALLATLNEILDAVILVLRGEFGNLELLDPARSVLRIVAQRGFDAEFLKAMGAVPVASGLAASKAIRGRTRVIIHDVNQDPEYAPYRELAKRAGYRTVQATPLLSGDGEVLGALVTHLSEPRDFSSHELQVLDLYSRQAADAIVRARAERELALVRSRLESALRVGEMGMYDWDMLSDRVYGDAHFQRMAGGVPFDAEGFASRQALNDRIHPDDREERLKRVRRAIAAREPYEAEYRIVTEGTLRWVISRGTIEYDETGTPKHFTGVLVDITARKHAEEALMEADRQKNEFLVQLAHELRNPLAAVRNAARILRINQVTPDNVTWAGNMVERQVKHLTRLIDDLLDLSRINRNKLELRTQKTALHDIINAAVEISTPLIDQRGHKLTVHVPSEPVFLFADSARLTQALSNLLTNAAKYTNPQGVIELAAGVEDDQVAISVRDNGIGIEASALGKVFNMFFQVDTTLEKTQDGLGIGLSLVKSLVELHGGAVEARSQGLGRGSEFLMRLPIRHSAESAHLANANGDDLSVSGVSRRVLVVDDNRDAAESLALFLQLAGHVVHTAFDGEQALEVAEHFRPDIALIDIGLPKLNGYEVCQWIRETDWGKSAMLIAQTGWGRDEDKQLSREAGFNGHLVKPADPIMVLRIVDAGHAAKIAEVMKTGEP
jgi:signal transduction histidine kinase/ActR/RegA family two-component response regulator